MGANSSLPDRREGPKSTGSSREEKGNAVVSPEGKKRGGNDPTQQLEVLFVSSSGLRPLRFSLKEAFRVLSKANPYIGMRTSLATPPLMNYVFQDEAGNEVGRMTTGVRETKIADLPREASIHLKLKRNLLIVVVDDGSHEQFLNCLMQVAEFLQGAGKQSLDSRGQSKLCYFSMKSTSSVDSSSNDTPPNSEAIVSALGRVCGKGSSMEKILCRDPFLPGIASISQLEADPSCIERALEDIQRKLFAPSACAAVKPAIASN